MSDRCQAKKLGMTTRPCPFFGTERLGDARAVWLCDKHMAFYWKLTDNNPDEADRIRRKVGMRR